MNQFRVRNVILPAVLVSSGVFSILTLPFVLDGAQTGGFEPPAFLKTSSQSVFDREDKNAAIRYVGSAIVVSVSAGIATIEILRRLHPSNRLSKTQKETLNSQIRQLEASGSDPALLSEQAETTLSEWLAEEPVADWTPQGDRDTTDFSETEAVVQEFKAEPHLNAETLPVSLSGLQAIAPPTFVSSESYETCRIKVPHRQSKLFAILLNGHYYSLVKMHQSKEKMTAIAIELRQQGEKAVITHIDQSNDYKYAVWMLQPDAYLEYAS